MRDHHQLEIWQRAMDYTVEIYRYSAGLPDVERFNPELTAETLPALISEADQIARMIHALIQRLAPSTTGGHEARLRADG